MQWYYLNEAGEVLGPVPEETLMELRSSGKIHDETPVCRVGTEVWISLSESIGQNKQDSHAAVDLLKFGCPHCGQHIAAETSDAGASTQCPTCGGEIVVPSINASGFKTPSGSGRGDVPDNLLSNKLEAGKPSKRRRKPLIIAALAVFACIALIVLFRMLHPDPLKAAIASAHSLFHGNGVTVKGRSVNGKTIYFLGESEIPFTGYIKHDFRSFNNKPERMYRLEDGLIREGWEWYHNGNLARHIVYKEANQPERFGEFSGSRILTNIGISSIETWKPNGKRCESSRVQNGSGTSIEYNEESNSAEETLRYENGDRYFGEAKKIRTKKKATNPDYTSSSDFDTGFKAGALGNNFTFEDRDAYMAGRIAGEKCKSMPAYTQGYNRGKEEGLQGIRIMSNPYNEISQKVEWLAWNFGYLEGNLGGSMSR